MANATRFGRLLRSLSPGGRDANSTTEEVPLRAELFSAEQMAHHGRALAVSHTLGTTRSRNRLLVRLADNEAVLVNTCRVLTEAIQAGTPITPAGEWLLDNFYLIEEQIRTARRHLPQDYSWQLPSLLAGASAGLPRVYDIALEVIAHGDGQFNSDSLTRFIVAYQSLTPLTLGELWAIPIMLRLALVENLRRVAARLAAAHAGRSTANYWTRQMLSVVERDPKSLILVVADMARSKPPPSSAFVAEFVRRLQGQSPALGLSLTWVEQWLAEFGVNINQLVQSESQHQAVDQVSIANSIGSLRLLAVLNWREFVETVSTVERVLREDPANTYGRMDFTTRDRYRHVVEKLAKRSGVAETNVAEQAIRMACAAATSRPHDKRSAHVGFYLVGGGRSELERVAGLRAPVPGTLLRHGAQNRLNLYLGAVGFLTLLLGGTLVHHMRVEGIEGGLLVLCAFLAVICASQLAIHLVNLVTTLIVVPEALPRMDYQAGLPRDARSLVVIPSMLTNEANIERLVDALEIRYLGNKDPMLHFGLLTDFADAKEEAMPTDASLLALASQRIAGLNDKYGDGRNDVFFLFHRPRRYNANEGMWMGEERKRGKLAALNALLRGDTNVHFSLVVGRVDALVHVRYVITLDTDTQLPRDCVRQLVATMMHPLNRPIYDGAKKRIVEGYGILQPRVAAALSATTRSHYTRLVGGEVGLDPYTRTVSDVYQDLFGEGSFIGKGIYDVDAFERTLKSRFPENRILSHDLLEGCYARSGLVSDVQLYEDDPTSYFVDIRRRHRWIRGDWQIASWLFSRVPSVNGGSEVNPLTLLSQWKIFDNLRRSLVPPALVLLLVLGWTVLMPAIYWTIVIVGMVALFPLLASAAHLAQVDSDIVLAHHLRATGRAALQRFAQTVFALACLPFEAFSSLDAIVRTTVRTLITRRRLLQWTPTGDLDHRNRGGIASSYRSMWPAPVIAMAAALAIVYLRPSAFWVAAPLLALWSIAPALAWWLSRPLARDRIRLNRKQLNFLRLLTRKTWGFFETMVDAQNNWLPPDNFQETPAPIVAHRTSPTNIGLSLLANLAAHDFGYVTMGLLLSRTRNTFETLQKLERYRGHFFNWYDTQTLQPLNPRYVSTVDSGNLAGHLLTLRQGLLELDRDVLVPARWFVGFTDTLAVLRGEMSDEEAPAFRALENELQSVLVDPPSTPAETRASVQRLVVCINECFEGAQGTGNASTWLEALERQCTECLTEIDLLAPWHALESPPQRLSPFFDTAFCRDLLELANRDAALVAETRRCQINDLGLEERQWLIGFESFVHLAADAARRRLTEVARLVAQADNFMAFDYSFLYDPIRHLMAIGYNASDHRCDTGYYDLLASEARLCTFLGVAQGRLPQQSWFALGRLLTHAAGEPILLSWSGSMFEYLMPMLVMPTFDNTLLDQTARAAVKRQIEYGHQRGIPWGISESGYNTVDAAFNYQYRAFGVPGLGLQRGLAEDLVIAPYATALGLMCAPQEACSNLQRLSASGCLGQFGMYEAVDYTAARLRRGEDKAIVRSFMAHHQGMTLLSLSHLLLDQPMPRRFASDPLVQTTLLLLQERVPRARTLYSNDPALVDLRATPPAPELPVRVFTTPDAPAPAVQLLSNGRYHVMVTAAGSGYSRWKSLAVTRWREDTTCDPWGTFCYLRDVATGKVWSPTYAPTNVQGEFFEASLAESRVEFRRRDGFFETHVEMVVSPEDDIELRRLRITNTGEKPRSIDVVSYAEVVINSPAADALHPAFSNLFIQTEIVPERQAIICMRRPRSPGDEVPNLLHLMTVHGGDVEDASYETDRSRFIGRLNTIADPAALRSDLPLSNSQGSVLDPIVAIRRRITLDPQETVIVDVVTGVAADRAGCIALIEKYQDLPLADRAFEMAWTHSQVVLRQLNITETDAQLYARLSGSIIYAGPAHRDGNIIARNRRNQSGLWGYAISGDLPIVLLQIKDPKNIELVRQLVQAHAYWRLKGLMVDLVIWNEERGGYRQLLHDQILGMVAAGVEANVIDRPGGIFLRAAEQISAEDRALLQSVARAIFADDRGSLAEQVRRPLPSETAIAPLAKQPESPVAPALPASRPALVMDNGLGGFNPDGTEYVVVTEQGNATPAPWVNVLANAHFGCVVSESGSAYTWSENAHEFRLTPWHNDPVTDATGEAFYVRDEETGRFWSPAPSPRCGVGQYISRHGFGYTTFEHTENGVATELSMFVALDAPIKFAVLKIRNLSGRARRLSATGYVEWVLGDLRPKTAMHVVTEIDAGSGTVLARNSYNPEFSENVAFFDVDDVTRTISGDRAEFIGRNGSLRNPAALTRSRLSGKVGAAMDPCAAIQVPFELADGQSREIIFRLGVGRGTEDASRLVQVYRKSGMARATLDAVKAYWKHTLGAVQISTPDQSIDFLANGWLIYQTLACRLWARSGFYQSGGAFGYRDQLQDAMALVHAAPNLLREHLLRAASRQFIEGDVQHWWHPPLGRGVRSRCSDDFLWLALATCRYVTTTGDWEVLTETAPYLEGRSLGPDEESYYDLPLRSVERTSLYQHCVRAIERGLAFGEHGLPLMGSGDWNDGMNNVGAHGKGESVWLGFFLFEILTTFVTIADRHGDSAFARRCQGEAQTLRANLDAHAWDGRWFRRAYFDDGTPLGSSSNAECQIDSIAQSWSVLSGAAPMSRAGPAMEALDKRLIDREHALVQLLAPPFDKGSLNPGYIRGYVPGVRENGGQYTHSAVWAAMAFAKLGDAERAWEVTQMINPVKHSASLQSASKYRAEPFVVAADIYGVAPHIGRGGWTWYTGSAGWTYRLILESLLGITREGDHLKIRPCLPKNWPSVQVHYRFKETLYRIEVRQGGDGSSARLALDGIDVHGDSFALIDDRAAHTVEIVLGYDRPREMEASSVIT